MFNLCYVIFFQKYFYGPIDFSVIIMKDHFDCSCEFPNSFLTLVVDHIVVSFIASF